MVTADAGSAKVIGDQAISLTRVLERKISVGEKFIVMIGHRRPNAEQKSLPACPVAIRWQH